MHNTMRSGLKLVALFEAFKALLVLFTGAALFSLIHQDIQAIAEQFVRHLHLNPAKHIPRIFIAAAGNLNDGRLLSLALLALLYSAMRLIEAYGLWFAKRWSEWFALVSGGIYLPIELYELTKGFTWIKIGLVTINLIIVLYMGFLLTRNNNVLSNNSTDKES